MMEYSDGRMVRQFWLKEVLSIMQGLYSKKTNIFLKRFKFSCLIRKPDEEVYAYLSRIKGAASNCSFESISNVWLVNQFAVGLNNMEVQQKIFSRFPNADCTLDELVEKASVHFVSRKSAEFLSEEKNLWMDNKSCR
ncbi:hypothetical protein RF11_02738 [Thelohanellus kitauei]|uniref:Retrotransposon gag domain-containing protein n=1 Tax=Thelohanellus kitauei TaxID=669202 RepID=A0A0C2J8A4_THEKT|nr:hypothetical protein RF11_02738 [Thelohanellus kitauei]